VVGSGWGRGRREMGGGGMQVESTLVAARLYQDGLLHWLRGRPAWPVECR
jgi:hypothetical protein